MPFGPALAGAAVSAGAGLIGSSLQSGAVRSGQKAAQAQFQQQRNDLAPFRTTGAAADTRAADLLNLNGQPAADAALADFRTSPGYQFQMDQGLRAVDAGAAAKGILRSGATLKAEQSFGSGLADSDFGQYYSRLKGLADTGEAAAAGGAVTSNAAATADLGGANAQSSIYGDAAKGIGTAGNTLLSSPQFQSWWNNGTNPSTGWNTAPAGNTQPFGLSY